ncbi:MAG: hypothetical protein ACREOU_09510 [Candidatus Eiseniibacteriota bacterium]
MNAGNPGIERHPRSPRTARGAALGALILLAATMAAAIAGHATGKTTREGALLAAAAFGLGTLAMAWWLAPRTRYPRWSVYTSGALLAGLLLAWAGLSAPGAWSESGMSTAWMMPWSLLVFGLGPAAGRGVCSPDHPRAGWILVGGTLLMGTILVLAGWIASRT